MPRFLLEVPHPPELVACARAIELLFRTGSHFITQSEWGCLDGTHCAWIILEADSKDEARRVLPPAFRSQARIVGLNRFTPDQIGELLKEHGMP